MKKLLSCFLAALIILIAGISFSTDGTGGDPFAFIKMGIGARPLGLGKAFVSIADDANATYWNPAGVAKMANFELTAMYSNPYADGIFGVKVEKIDYHMFSMGYPIVYGDMATGIGMNVLYLNVGDMEEYDELGNALGKTFSDRELLATLSIAQKITSNFFVGLNVKEIYQYIYSGEYSGFVTSFDLGVMFEPLLGLNTGLLLQDIYATTMKFSGESPYRKIKFGLSYTFKSNKPDENSISFFDRIIIAGGVDTRIQGSSYRDYPLFYHVGLEYFIIPSLGLRAGYSSDNQEISAGFGLAVSKFKVDYTAGFNLNLGNTHRVSVSAGF